MSQPPSSTHPLDRQDAAVRTAGVGVWLNPLPLGELVWNDNTKAHFHLPPDARPTIALFFERLHPDDRERVRRGVERAMEQGRTFDEVYRTVGPTGQTKWIHAVGRTVFADDGTPQQFDGITLDISAAIAAQQQLREFADSAPAILWVTEASGLCTFLSRGWTSFTGQSEIAGLGYGWLEMVHPQDRAQAEAVFQRANAEHSSFALEHRVRRAHGDWAWVIDAGQPRWGPDGAYQGFVGSVTDIHERRMAEEAMRRSNQRYARLMESIDQGFCVVRILLDAHGRPHDYRFLETNHVFEKQTGLRHPVGRTARELVPELEDFWFQTYGTVALTQQPVRFTHGSEAMDRWFDVFASPMGEPGDLEVAILFQDITDRKRAEAGLLEASRRKDEFLATLAHELRNPLASIRSAADLLHRSPVEARAAPAEVIVRQAAHLAHMIDDLMDVSRVTRGRLELRLAPVALADVLRSTVDSAQAALQKGPHPLALELPAAPLWVMGDEVRLVQVFLNLVSNAVRYSAAGQPITIALEHADGTHAVVRVRDQGIGIAQDKLTQVFELFYQGAADSDRAAGGLGIGLSLVQRLTELHGGTVQVFSAGAGHGSEFVVRLPLITAPRPEAPAPASVPKPGADALSQALRVLIVDDNRDAVDTMAELLRLMDFEVVVAYDGMEALACADVHRPDVVVLDIGMPRMDGYATCRALRQTASGQGAIVLALSGWGQPNDRERTRAAGFDGHLVKPIAPEALVEAIRQARSAQRR